MHTHAVMSHFLSAGRLRGFRGSLSPSHLTRNSSSQVGGIFTFSSSETLLDMLKDRFLWSGRNFCNSLNDVRGLILCRRCKSNAGYEKDDLNNQEKNNRTTQISKPVTWTKINGIKFFLVGKKPRIYILYASWEWVGYRKKLHPPSN